MATLQLSKGYIALIDDADLEWLSQWKWSVTVVRGIPYARRNEQKGGNQKSIRMARLIMDAPKGVQVDHRNKNSLDNRRCNLRFATVPQNCQNRKCRVNSLSGLKGVLTRRYGFGAEIQAFGVRIPLGTFKTAELAHAAYCKAAAKYHGQFAQTQ